MLMMRKHRKPRALLLTKSSLMKLLYQELFQMEINKDGGKYVQSYS